MKPVRAGDLPKHLQNLAGKSERKPRRGVMNQLERDYADTLSLAMKAGEIRWFGFEPMSLRLADGVKFTPDFGVIVKDGTLQFAECKGSWKAKGQRDARTKIKVAASLYPFRFVVVMRSGDGWYYEMIPGLFDALAETDSPSCPLVDP